MAKKARTRTAETQENYQAYLKYVSPTQEELEQQKQDRFLQTAPFWSIVCGEGSMDALLNTLHSLQQQTYSAWEIWSASQEEQDAPKGIAFAEPGPGETSLQAALRQAQGTYILLLQPGDRLQPDALYRLSCAAECGGKPDILYADEDRITPEGERHSPNFKPAYAPHTLMSRHYLGRMVALSRTLLQAVGGIKHLMPETLYDLHLRCMERAGRVLHLPLLLLSTPDDSPMAPSLHGGKAVLEQALKRRGNGGYACGGIWSGSFSTQYGLRGDPKISILITDTGGFVPLRRLLESFEELNAYENHELFILSNGRQDPQTYRYYAALEKNRVAKVIEYTGYSLGGIRAWGAREANGELMLFLNSNLEFETPDTLYVMAALASQPDVGAVGACLVSPDHTIYSAGTVVGLYGWEGALFRGAPEKSTDSLHRQFVQTVRNVSAVSGECMMVERERYRKSGGFDPSFTQAGWAADLCLRMGERGFYSVYTPYARFVRYPYQVPQPTEQNLQRCMDAFRPVLSSYDPYYGPQYDYSRPIPELAVPPVSPMALNSGVKAGI